MRSMVELYHRLDSAAIVAAEDGGVVVVAVSVVLVLDVGCDGSVTSPPSPGVVLGVVQVVVKPTQPRSCSIDTG
jgi:hypothetical protein